MTIEQDMEEFGWSKVTLRRPTADRDNYLTGSTAMMDCVHIEQDADGHWHVHFHGTPEAEKVMAAQFGPDHHTLEHFFSPDAARDLGQALLSAAADADKKQAGRRREVEG